MGNGGAGERAVAAGACAAASLPAARDGAAAQAITQDKSAAQARNHGRNGE
jgi:hypothetical protein